MHYIGMDTHITTLKRGTDNIVSSCSDSKPFRLCYEAELLAFFNTIELLRKILGWSMT